MTRTREWLQFQSMNKIWPQITQFARRVLKVKSVGIFLGIFSLTGNLVNLRLGEIDFKLFEVFLFGASPECFG